MNKKSITCDLKSPAGIQLIYGLLPKADVIVENMGPGSIERLGLGYEKCREFNDKIIFASIKGFSKTSPYTDYPAFDPIATHTGGFVSLTGTPEMPLKAGVSVADSGSGLICAMSICAALYQRNVQGLGQRIDIAMQDYIIGLCRSSWEPYYNTGETPRRVGNGMPLGGCGAGGHLPLQALRTQRLRPYLLLQGAGQQKLRNAVPYYRQGGPADGRPVLHTAITVCLQGHSRRDHHGVDRAADTSRRRWTSWRKADIPAGAVLDIADITNEPHYMDEGMIIEVEHQQLGKMKVPGFAPAHERKPY